MDVNFWAIIGSAVTVLGFLYTFLRNFKKDMDERFDKMDAKLEKKFYEMDQRVTETNKRMDGVYNILLKRTE